MAKKARKVEVSGASDDLIELEGDIREEFEGGEDTKYLAFSDGTVLSVQYANDGMWRVNRLREGTAAYEKVEGTDVDNDYSDKVTLTGDLTWAVCGDSFAKA